MTFIPGSGCGRDILTYEKRYILSESMIGNLPMSNHDYLDAFCEIPSLSGIGKHIQTMIGEVPATFSITKHKNQIYNKFHIRYHYRGKRYFICILVKDPYGSYREDDFDMQIQMRAGVMTNFNIIYTIKNGGRDVFIDANRNSMQLHYQCNPEHYEKFNRYLEYIVPKWSKHDYPG